jgi:hypothetical protein
MGVQGEVGEKMVHRCEKLRLIRFGVWDGVERAGARSAHQNRERKGKRESANAGAAADGHW